MRKTNEPWAREFRVRPQAAQDDMPQTFAVSFLHPNGEFVDVGYADTRAEAVAMRDRYQLDEATLYATRVAGATMNPHNDYDTYDNDCDNRQRHIDALDGQAALEERDEQIRQLEKNVELLAGSLRGTLNAMGSHGPCEENSCERCTTAYYLGVKALTTAGVGR